MILSTRHEARQRREHRDEAGMRNLLHDSLPLAMCSRFGARCGRSALGGVRTLHILSDAEQLLERCHASQNLLYTILSQGLHALFARVVGDDI